MVLENRHYVKIGYFAFFAVAISAILYYPSLGGDWLWDDNTSVYNNSFVTSPGQFHKIWFSFEDQDYWPLTRSTFRLEYLLFGNNVSSYRVVNLLLHVAVCILLFLLGRQFQISGTLWAVLIFLVHPTNVSTVAWISELKNLLMMVCLIPAALFFDKYSKSSDRKSYLLSVFFFLFALFAKTAAVFFPFIILIIHWKNLKKFKIKNVVPVIPFFLASGVLGSLTMFVQYRKDFSGMDILEWPLRLASCGWALAFYLYKAIWPTGLCMIYPNWKQSLIDFGLFAYIPVLITSIFCLFLIINRRKQWARDIILFLFPFILMLFPVLGLFKMLFMQHSQVADFYLYPALPVFCFAASAWIHSRIVDKTVKIKRFVLILLSLYILMCAYFTHTRAAAFYNSERLWRNNLDHNPNAWVGHQILANTLVQKILNSGNTDKYKKEKSTLVDEALHHYKTAISLNPYSIRSYNNLGCLMLDLGRESEAKEYFLKGIKKAEEISGISGDALLNMGQIELRHRNLDKAEHYLLKALLSPKTVINAYKLLGRIYMQQHNIQKLNTVTINALSYYKTSHDLRFGIACEHVTVLRNSGKNEDAQSALTQYLKEFPQNPKLLELKK